MGSRVEAMHAGNNPPHVVFNQFWRGLIDTDASLNNDAYPGLYDGLLGQYTGLAGEYDGLVGLYDGLVGLYDGLVGWHTPPAAGAGAPNPATDAGLNPWLNPAADGVNPATDAGLQSAPPNSPPAAGAGAAHAPAVGCPATGVAAGANGLAAAGVAAHGTPKSPPVAGAAHLKNRLAGGGCAQDRPKTDLDFGIRAPYLLHLKESGAQ